MIIDFSALGQSTGLVAIAEIGDKTQLLSFMLAARYRVFWPIFAGIFVATVANHAAVAWLGQWLGSAVQNQWLATIASVVFIGVGIWALVPDDAPEEDARINAHGAFVASVLAFFLAEMGDKTQLATLTLGAHYGDVVAVTLGTTLGMMLANIPAVWCGESLLARLPLRYVRWGACVAFVSMGLAGLAATWL